ncbi:MAG: PaaI family thioesterase [Desulfobacteraceae bacterium]|nr:PaaI family thioesterase [Desulfobacteraceae bacterium]
MPQIDFSKMTLIQSGGNGTSFGCGSNNPYGLQMTYYTDGQDVYSRLSVKEHLCGWNNIVHGGIVTAILDEVQFWAVFYSTCKVPLTKDISISLAHPVPGGCEVVAHGRLKERPNESHAIATGRLYYNDILCAESSVNFATISLNAAKRLNIFSKSDFEWARGVSRDFQARQM